MVLIDFLLARWNQNTKEQNWYQLENYDDNDGCPDFRGVYAKWEDRRDERETSDKQRQEVADFGPWYPHCRSTEVDKVFKKIPLNI